MVFPNADYKFYFKADLQSRVNRRYLDIKPKDSSITKKYLKEMIKDRDYKDLNRKISPLRKAEGAILVVTTNMKIEEQIDYICSVVLNNR